MGIVGAGGGREREGISRRADRQAGRDILTRVTLQHSFTPCIRPPSPTRPPRADLNLYPAREWKGRGWDWCDSMDPQRELDGFSDADIPDPERGAEG